MNPYSPLKVYVASAFGHRPLAVQLKKLLEDAGAIVTSTWLTDADGNTANMATMKDKFHECRMRATKDFEDIDAADVVVVLRPSLSLGTYVTGGCHVETGYAMAKGKPVYLFGARENVFHYHPRTVHVEFVSDLFPALGLGWPFDSIAHRYEYEGFSDAMAPKRPAQELYNPVCQQGGTMNSHPPFLASIWLGGGDVRLIAKCLFAVRLGDLSADEMVTASFLARKLDDAVRALAAREQEYARTQSVPQESKKPEGEAKPAG